MTTRMNAMWNCKNPHQGTITKVLAICSAGLLRSPTIAKECILKGYNARSAGCQDYALIPVDKVLLEWADVIIFADESHEKKVKQDFDLDKNKITFCLNIPDNYGYNNPDLVKRIREGLMKCSL